MRTVLDSDTFRSLASDFLEALFARLQEVGVEIPWDWEIDHLCYRVDSVSRYEELKNQFARFGELLIESEVNGRMIATYKLTEPIAFRGWKVGLVELPSPKPSKKVPEGFEHIEVVAPVPLAELEKRYAHLELDRSGLSKKLNPELEIVLGARNVKFHPLSLEEVIRIEKSQRL